MARAPQANPSKMTNYRKTSDDAAVHEGKKEGLLDKKGKKSSRGEHRETIDL
jgi:hypothetical protein